MSGSGRTRAILVAAVWLCFVGKAVFYASFMPIWEGEDEYAHFAFVQYLAETHSLPSLRDTSVSREIAESLQLAPVPWTIRNPGSWIPHDEFWHLPAEVRQERAKSLRTLPLEWGSQPAQPFVWSYESQPPLAYLVFLPLYLAFKGADLATRIWILRIAGAAIASLAIPLAYLGGLRTFASPWRAIGTAVVVASMPQLFLNVTRVGNEPLAVLLGTACICILLSLPDRLDKPLAHGLSLGAAFGCALLTKAYFLALIPAIAVIYAALWVRRRDHRRSIVFHAIVAACTTLIIAGWWYARNMISNGTVSGEQMDAASKRSGVSMMQAIGHANWFHTVDFLLFSHIWIGGWSFLVLRTWMYRVVEGALLAALLGLGWRLIRRCTDVVASRLAICAVLAGCFWIAPAYHAMVTYRVRGVAETFGYYAYCVVAAEAICLIAGLSAWLPRNGMRFAVPGLVAGFAALEVYGVVFLLMPYYAGLTMHNAGGSVPAMHLSMLAHGGFHRLFTNLAAFKPAALSPGVIEGLWGVFLAAVPGIIGIAFFVALRDKEKLRQG